VKERRAPPRNNLASNAGGGSRDVPCPMERWLEKLTAVHKLHPPPADWHKSPC
jgi:hypothetical protein